MHQYTPDSGPAVEQLHANGVHFVRCRRDDEGTKRAKSALDSGWQLNPASLEAVLKHRAAGGLLGFVPGRSGLLVIDVDKFPTEDRAASALVARLGILPLAVVSTQRGIHLYLKRSPGDGEIPNRAWAAHGYSGDVRCDHGYVIGWKLGQLVVALGRLPASSPTSIALFPKPLKVMSNGQGFTVGNRTNHLNKLVYAAALRGETDFSVPCKLALAADLPPDKIATIVKKAVADAEAKKGATFARKDGASVLEEVFERQGWQVRYNQRSMRCDWSLDAGATWGSTTDRAEKKRRRTIAETFSYNSVKEGKKIIRPLVYGRDAWEEHLGAILADHEVDPFRLWLESLPPWDGVKRVHSLLTDTFKADDNLLTRWASTALLLGPVQRTFEPGCKLDEVVVLVGGQGLGKSSIINHLLPQTEPDWFSDSLSMADNQQKRVESLQGRVLCEMSDLQGFTKADMQSLKSFITRRDDGSVRLSYRRNPETMMRRCVLVGTSDRAECLPNDSAGLRRFVPVECREGCHVEQFMTENRSRLWAEALAIYQAGKVRANLPRNLMVTQSVRAEAHRRKDGLVEDAVAAIVGEGPFTIRELFGMACPASSVSDRRAEGRLADALRSASWTKRRGRDVNGKLAYLWRRAEAG